MKIKMLIIIVLVLATAFLGILALFPRKVQKAGEDRLKVAASFYPLYFFTREVGGEKVEVINITPAGVEPHEYEPTAGEIAKVSGSDLLIVLGRSFETWAEKIKIDLKQSGVNMIEIGEGLISRNDPHVWLSPPLARVIVKRVAEALSQADPLNKEYYLTNAKTLDNQLSELDQKISKDLMNCRRKEFVASHEAFTYFAENYGLNQVAIAGISPDEEPSTQDLIDIARAAREKGIRYIFFETLVSPKLSETVASEIGAQTTVLDPLEGVPLEKQETENYFTIMEQNLTNLRTALECQ